MKMIKNTKNFDEFDEMLEPVQVIKIIAKGERFKFIEELTMEAEKYSIEVYYHCRPISFKNHIFLKVEYLRDEGQILISAVENG